MSKDNCPEFKVFSVIPVKVRAYCPECGGELKSSGEMLASSPPQYIHRCRKCEFLFRHKSKFPEIRYQEIEDQDE